MPDRENTEQEQRMDSHLDVPAEANTDKHINFVQMEENDVNDNGSNKDRSSQERKKEWKEGLKEGREEAESK